MAFIALGTAFLMAGLAIPMILRKVPMNDFYGARFKASFQSPHNWYEINAYGGKALLWAALPTALCGVSGLVFVQNESWYPWLAIAVMLLAATGAAALTWRKSLTIDRPE